MNVVKRLVNCTCRASRTVPPLVVWHAARTRGPWSRADRMQSVMTIWLSDSRVLLLLLLQLLLMTAHLHGQIIAKRPLPPLHHAAGALHHARAERR